MHPFRRSTGFLSLLALSFCTSARAACLGPATVAAWDEYTRCARLGNERRAAAGETFLWVDGAPGRSARARAGEIVVAPTRRRGATRVPDGLIHDWMGAAFIPGVHIEDVLSALRDYSRYKDWFQPAVAESGLLASGAGTDRFSMVLVNESFFHDAALAMQYESRFCRLDEHRGYSVSRSTRVQEIEKYRSADEHLLPEGEGSGMVWKLMSITRYAERDGGVYLELEALGLSRDIPASLRWVIEPVVRHLLRAALRMSLRQTAEAVLSDHAARVSEVTGFRSRGGSNKAEERMAPHR